MKLKTERLILRTLTEGDAPLLLDFDTRNREFLAPWEPLREASYFTLARAQSSIRADALMARRRLGYRWHFFLKDDPGRIVGSVAVSGIIRGAFWSAYLGYRLEGTMTGRGLGTEGVGAAVDWALGPGGLHRVEANVMPHNAPSRRLLVRLGFHEEGLALRYLNIAGVWQDHLHFARLAEEAP